MAKILMVGAFDTKGPEYAFLREQILARGHEVLAMNTGVIGEASAFPVDIGADEVEVFVFDFAEILPIKQRCRAGIIEGRVGSGSPGVSGVETIDEDDDGCDLSIG